ncbi:MAG: YcgL domain-containing protein [Porticoccaceae bacterium]
MVATENTSKVLCTIYRSRKQADLYLFVRQNDGLTLVPQELLARFGEPEQVVVLALTPERRLARRNATEVLAALTSKGYYLQMPPTSDGLMASIGARNEKLPRA